MHTFVCPKSPLLLPQNTSDLQAIRKHFAGIASLPLRQAWSTHPDERFRPGSVALTWQPGELLVYAELEDDEIYSDAVGLNDQTWEKGDVFELFFRNPTESEYLELHVTPHNCKLQLRIPSREDLIDRDQRHAVMGNFELQGEVFHSHVWINANHWALLCRIPFCELQIPHNPTDSQLLYSFSRYDSTRGLAPILSSTSSHSVLNFHRQHEWGQLRFSAR